ncbi:MAG: CHAT domain-containing protein [Candidatus Brocadiia bacterium]
MENAKKAVFTLAVLFAGGFCMRGSLASPQPDQPRCEYQCSLVEYMEIGQHDPKWDNCVRDGLELLLVEEDAFKARLSFEKAYELGCRDFELLYRLGDSCMKTGATVQGEKFLSLAAEMYPKVRYVRIHAAQPDILLGDYYYGFVPRWTPDRSGANDAPRALAHYQRVGAQAKVQEVEYWIKRNDDATKSIRAAEKEFMDKPSADSAFRVSQGYNRLTRPSQEALWLDKAIAINPEHTEALIARINCATVMNDYDRGEAFIPRAITAAEKSKDPCLLSRAHAAAAQIFMYHGFANRVEEVRGPRGKPAHEHALAAVEAAKRGNDDRTLYDAYHVLANSYWVWSGQFRYDLAIGELEHALAIAEKHGWNGEATLCKYTMALRYAEMKNYDKENALLRECGYPPVDPDPEKDQHYFKSEYEQSMAQVTNFEKDVNRVIDERAKRAALSFESFRFTYGSVIAACLHLGRYEEVFLTSERARAASFLALMGGKTTQTREQLNDQRRMQVQALQTQVAQLQDQVALLQKTGQADGLRSARRDLAVQSQALETVQAHVRLADQEITSLTRVDPLTLPQIQEILGEATLIEYSGQTGPGINGEDDECFIAIVTRDSFQVIHGVDFQYDRVQRLCQRFRKAGDNSAAKARADPDWDKACQELYKEFFKPVRPYIKTKQIIIVPYGGMNLVPFACLKDENGRYLLEDYSISCAPSGSVLKFCQAKRKPKMEKALILANPQLVEAGSVLKFAEVEAESVGKLFPQSVLLRGAEASKSAFVKLSPGYDVLHLACHGVMDQTEPMLSNLRLAGDNENNGVLTVREIFDLNLDAGLVTLSACNTGTGEVTGSGFEFMGMTRAFLYAGTPSVLASLWCVDDRATAELMELFYKNLLAGLTKSEALQKAQLTMMKKYENPYYWGAFVLYGDYR